MNNYNLLALKMFNRIENRKKPQIYSKVLHKFSQKPPHSSINLNPRTSASEKRFKYPKKIYAFV